MVVLEHVSAACSRVALDNRAAHLAYLRTAAARCSPRMPPALKGVKRLHKVGVRLAPLGKWPLEAAFLGWYPGQRNGTPTTRQTNTPADLFHTTDQLGRSFPGDDHLEHEAEHDSSARSDCHPVTAYSGHLRQCSTMTVALLAFAAEEAVFTGRDRRAVARARRLSGDPGFARGRADPGSDLCCRNRRRHPIRRPGTVCAYGPDGHHCTANPTPWQLRTEHQTRQ